MIVDRRKLETFNGIVNFDLPAGSIPRSFINQSGTVYLWFSNSNSPTTERHQFAIVNRSEKEPSLASFMQDIKVPKDGYALIYYFGVISD